MLCTADVPHHVSGYFKAIVVYLTCGFQMCRRQINMHSARQDFFTFQSPQLEGIFFGAEQTEVHCG